MKKQLLLLIGINLVLSTQAIAETSLTKKIRSDFAYQFDKQLPKPKQVLKKDRSKKVRQGTFARKLIHVLNKEDSLPLTATEDDCISLLESWGISPLKGWDANDNLTSDDHTVITLQLSGKEHLVHQKAQELCDMTVKRLNINWELYYAQNSRYLLLEKLVTEGPGYKCPYGKKYQVGGFKPHILSHTHYIKTPLKRFLRHAKN